MQHKNKITPHQQNSKKKKKTIHSFRPSESSVYKVRVALLFQQGHCLHLGARAGHNICLWLELFLACQICYILKFSSQGGAKNPALPWVFIKHILLPDYSFNQQASHKIIFILLCRFTCKSHPCVDAGHHLLRFGISSHSTLEAVKCHNVFPLISPLPAKLKELLYEVHEHIP